VGGVVVAGLPRLAVSAAQSAAQDAEIFNLALLLEYTQAAFYAEAVEREEIPGELLEFATVVADHERAHVDYLRDALGGDARAEPSTDFGEATANPDAFGAADRRRVAGCAGSRRAALRRGGHREDRRDRLPRGAVRRRP
jgi:hypothetical protein